MSDVRDRKRGLTGCEAPGCDRTNWSAGLCSTHYQRNRRGQRLDGFDHVAMSRELATVMPCVAHGCDRPISNVRRGVCDVHYQRIRENDSYAKRGRAHLLLPRVTPTEKKCNTCGEVKPTSAFGRYAKNVDGLLGRCTPCRTAYNRDRNYKLRGKYDLSNQEYLAMVEAQGGLCAICGANGSANRVHGKLYVDHCHDSGKVRGLLCHGCNVSIGWMKDDPERLEAAAAYLRERG